MNQATTLGAREHVRPRYDTSAQHSAVVATASSVAAASPILTTKSGLATNSTSSPTANSVASSSKPAATTADKNQNASDTQTAPPKPAYKPANPNFSSGPCAKHPGWSLDNLDTRWLGRSHRAKGPKQQLQSAITRCKNLMELPEDWRLGIVPGSDTGAFEMAIWSLLGQRPVNALVWESFSSDWASDLAELGLDNLIVTKADYGSLPDLSAVNSTDDLVFVANGTTSGVRVPDFNFIDVNREGLALCDATSAVFAMEIDYSRVDVVTWSWQKVLGGEAAHGMIALSPSAVERLQQPAPRPLPKIFKLAKNGKLIEGIFSGATINTPSMLAIADLHVALDWAESVGGTKGLRQRSQANFDVMNKWVEASAWVEWLATDPVTRSTTSMCLSIKAPEFSVLDDAAKKDALVFMLKLLETEEVAFDIAHYRSAPTGFRVWGGATVEHDDIQRLTEWLDWAFTSWLAEQNVLESTSENSLDRSGEKA